MSVGDGDVDESERMSVLKRMCKMSKNRGIM